MSRLTAGHPRSRRRPSLAVACVGAGVVIATGLLVASMTMFFSISKTVPGDFDETATPAFAVAHGAWHCAYSIQNDYPIPPLYPVVAGSVMDATGIGSMKLPGSRSDSGRCRSTTVSTFQWHGPLFFAWLLGLLGWPSLLAGLVLAVRASGRGPSRLDIVGLCLVGCALPVATALIQFFHPEDLFAMGLLLGALAAALRRRWLATGVLVALACCTKQYALLAAVPLVVVTAAAILTPLAVVMGKGMIDALAGANATLPGADTLIGTSGLHGWMLVAFSRGSPLLLSAMTALWARLRLGAAVMEPSTLTALLAVSLALRLLFEVNLYDYYFMALSVALVTADMIGGRIRFETVAWLLPTGMLFSGLAPFDLMQQRFPVPMQMLVVLSGLTLAAQPLWRACHARRGSDAEDPHRRVLAAPGRRKVEVMTG
jgi:hypothetical protein